MGRDCSFFQERPRYCFWLSRISSFVDIDLGEEVGGGGGKVAWVTDCAAGKWRKIVEIVVEISRWNNTEEPVPRGDKPRSRVTANTGSGGGGGGVGRERELSLRRCSMKIERGWWDALASNGERSRRRRQTAQFSTTREIHSSGEIGIPRVAL